MSKLAWGVAGSRLYETGVDRGVLYVAGESGVPWNGLISVTESPTGGEPQPYYADGFKYANISTSEEFEASIEAYAAPPEFAKCEGLGTIHTGLFIGQQPRKPFSLVYRTRIGSDLSPEYGYKIHIIYNALTGPSERVNTTLNDSPEAMTKSWEITTTPPNIAGYRPSSHIVIDSRLSDPVMLGYLEGVLYGAENMEPRIISANEIIALFSWQASGRTAPIYLVGNAATDSEFVENLNTNPSFETSSGTVEVRRNLEPNPSFETTESSYEVWRNLAINPSFENPSGTPNTRINHATNPRAANGHQAAAGEAGWRTTRWFGGGGGVGDYTWVGEAVDGPQGITSYLRKTWTVSPTSNGDTGFDNSLGSTSGFPVVPGRQYAFSSYVRSSAPGKEAARIRIFWRDSSGAAMGGSESGNNIPLSAGTWHRLTYVTVAPAGAAYAVIHSDVTFGTVWLPGDTLDGTGLLVEESGIIEHYFDGFRSPSDDFTYLWGGTANQSKSFQRGVGVSDISAMQNGVAIQSTQWSSSGTKSVRTIPKSTISSDNSIVVAGYPGMSMTGHGVTFEPGKTYTVSVTCRLSAPQIIRSGTHGGARKIQLVTNSAVGWTGANVVYSDAAPNVAGSHRLRLTFTIPANAVVAGVRLMNGALHGDGDVWWDDFMLVENGVYTEYFDGDSVDTADFNYAWTGTPHASASIISAVTPVGWGYNRGSRKMWASTVWATKPGGKSVAVQAMAPNYDSFAEARIAAASGDLAGRTFTVQVTRHTTENLPGSRDGRAWRILWAYYSDSGTGNLMSEIGPETAGTYEMKATFTFPAGARGTAFFRLYNGSSTPNNVIYWDDLVVTEGVYHGGYFDGSTPAGGDFTYEWTGTANASTSIKRAMGIGGYGANSPDMKLYQSSAGALSGTKTAQLVVTRTDNNPKGFYIPGDIRPAATPGQTYTAFGSIRQEEGSLSDVTVKVALYFYNTSNGYLSEIGSAQVPTSTEYVDPKVSGVAPEGVGYVGMAVTVHGAKAGDRFSFDSALLTNDDYSTDDPYFDGDTTDVVIYRKQQVFPQWEATAHASVSEFSFYPSLDREARPNDAMLVGTELWIYGEEGYWKYFSEVPGLTV